MIFPTEDYINERSLELFNEASSIKDEELRTAAQDFCRKRIESLRQVSTVLEDDEFWYELLGQAEGDETFMQKIELLKQML